MSLDSVRYSCERGQIGMRGKLLTILDLKYLGLHPVSTPKVLFSHGKMLLTRMPSTPL
jgi:hypothetical protein